MPMRECRPQGRTRLLLRVSSSGRRQSAESAKTIGIIANSQPYGVIPRDELCLSWPSSTSRVAASRPYVVRMKARASRSHTAPRFQHAGMQIAAQRKMGRAKLRATRSRKPSIRRLPKPVSGPPARRTLSVQSRAPRPRGPMPRAGAMKRGIRKFLRYFSNGFHDETYIAWERAYKWTAHENWNLNLGRDEFQALLERGDAMEVAARASRIEGRTNLLFSFEKMALRDAVRTPAGAHRFANGLYAFLHDGGNTERGFERWCAVLEALPRKQTRVLTWPLATVFGFIAEPTTHMFLKPNVTRRAAGALQLEFAYRSRPNWSTYAKLLDLAETVRRELRELHPRDMIDLQSFLWVQGSDEYPD